MGWTYFSLLPYSCLQVLEVSVLIFLRVKAGESTPLSVLQGSGVAFHPLVKDLGKFKCKSCVTGTKCGESLKAEPDD